MSKQKLKYIDESVESTEDCVKLLNEQYKTGKWKRKTKFKLPNKNEVRIFTDGNDMVSIVNTDEGAIICPEIDLSTLRPLIDKIESVCQNIYDCDGYGNVFLNPYDMKLWITGSDCGILYAESVKELKKIAANEWQLEEGEEDINEKVEKLLPELKIQIEAEAFPTDEDDEEEVNFFEIGQTKQVDEVEGMDEFM